jgi:3-oxoacyl-[acyl-carrier-protein] synthase II
MANTMRRNRVVITGMGILAPNGIGLDEFWDSLLNGRSGIGPITLFDASELKSRIAGEVKDFDPHDYIAPELKPRRMARHTQLAYAAAMLALKDAGLDVHRLDLPSPTPVIIGVSTSAMDILERGFRDLTERGPQAVSPGVVVNCQPQAPANVIADRVGASAHATTVSSACPSGLDAVADAAALIRSGQAEIAIAGGTDSPITPLGIASFVACGLSSYRNTEPEKADRPFDISRDTGVISEGAGVFVVENLERAESRGVRAYIEITGYSKQRDRDPEAPASGLEDSMKMAVANSQCDLEDIDYISAYGPGHPMLDAIEISMIKRVFGQRAYEVPVVSIKGVTGNPLAAGGCFQLAAAALSVRDNMIPPTTNCELPDPACDLDIVQTKPRKLKVDCALLNVRGLGGSASSMVINRVQG